LAAATGRRQVLRAGAAGDSRTCPVPPRWAFPGWRRSGCS